MTGIILISIFWWSSILVLCCWVGLAGAADRIRDDEKYSFKKLYEKHDQQALFNPFSFNRDAAKERKKNDEKYSFKRMNEEINKKKRMNDESD